jgi:hypothetical protein
MQGGEMKKLCAAAWLLAAFATAAGDEQWPTVGHPNAGRGKQS